MSGIKETTEAVQGVFAVVRKGFEIRSEGVAGLPKLIAIYPQVQAGIAGSDQIDDELKELDEAEVKALFKLAVTEMGLTFEAAGLKRFSPYLLLMAEAVEAGETTYTAFKPVIEKFKALSKPTEAK